MTKFATGKLAYGFSDRSGKRYPIKDLIEQYENRRPNGLLVGKDELDIDHEQLQVGRVRSEDPQSLENPRVDLSLGEANALSAFDPVGGGLTEFGSSTVGLTITGHVGRVTVSTS